MRKTVLTSMLCIALSGIVQAQQQADTLRIFFAVGKSMIDESNTKILDELITTKNLDSIRIYGFADFLGNAAYNQQLSEKRSRSAYNYLVEKGIRSKSIVIFKGEGVYPNSAEEYRQDISDKGIQAHRMVQIIYSVKSQNNSLSEENLVANANIVLQNILFRNNSDVFRKESYPALNELLSIMQKIPTLKIEIQGYICCKPEGTEGMTRDGRPVSVIRAKAVYDYLVTNGIDPSRLTYKGFGASNKRYPLEQNEDEKRMNRRVEILILER